MSFFDLFLAIFGKNPVSGDLGQNQHSRAFFSLKKSEWSYSGVRSWKMAYFRPYEGHFGTFWQLFGHIWLKGPIQNNFFIEFHVGQQNWVSNLTFKISHFLTYVWLFSVKILYCPIWTKIPNKDHFFHLKNLNCHNPGSDCEKWHFSGLTEAFLAIFICHIWPILINYQRSCVILECYPNYFKIGLLSALSYTGTWSTINSDHIKNSW